MTLNKSGKSQSSYYQSENTLFALDGFFGSYAEPHAPKPRKSNLSK